MTERDPRIGELYEAALKKPIGERASFVAQRAGGDEDLRRRVEALLSGQQDTQLPGYESGGGSGTVLAAGTQIGSYVIDGPLGAGGMGVVYRATDTKLHRPAAIKVLPENLADPEARRRFQREAQMVSSLNHPHIVTVYDAGEYLERQYLITEYVDGGTLRQWAARPRGWRPIVELLIGVADAIATAHDAGILHRDIKPENILLAKNGYAKLADFGLAKLFEADPFADDPLAAMRGDGKSSLIGTAAYMSPEQAQGLPLDGRSDVYSFGLVLYELLAGSRPFAGREAGQPGGAEPMPPLGEDVPAELRTIVAKALESEPADRYHTMRDLVIDLRRVARRSGIDPRDASGRDVAASEAPASSGIRTGAVSAPMQRNTSRHVAYVLAALVIFIIAALLGRSYMRDEGAGAASVRVAVLPFRGESSGPDDLPISESFGDTLRDELAPLPGLRVAARASTFALRDQNLDLRTLASRLDVSVLVTGSVRRNADDTLSVSVEVVDGDTGTIDFSKSYQGTLLAVERQLAGDVSTHLSPAGRAPPAVAVPTTEAAAARALVFARHFAREVRDSPVVDLPKLNKAIDYYREAVAADPQSEVAYSGLAAALLYRGDFDEASVVLKKALEFGQRSETFYTLALYSLRGGPQTAPYIEDAFEKAIALNPNNEDAVGDYALWRWVHRDAESADGLFQHALALDPQSLSRYSEYAEFLGSYDVEDRLLELAELIKVRFPNGRGYRVLARLYELAGAPDIGIGWALRALEAQPDDVDTKLQIAELYARLGDFRTARIYEPEPVGLSELLFERRYRELIDLAEENMLDDPGNLDVRYMLAFAHNVERDFAASIRLLEEVGLPETALADSYGVGETQSLATWADAQLASGFADKAKEPLERYLGTQRATRKGAGYAGSWWNNAYVACALANLGRTEQALERLERTRSNLGLIWLPLLKDAWCFQRFQNEPRYQAVVKIAEDRQASLRQRLPTTLREQFPELKTNATP